MADVKSNQIQTLDAQPTEVLEPGVLAGRVRTAQFQVDLTNATQNDNIYLIDLPPNAYLVGIRLFQDGADTTNFDLGDANDQDRLIDGQAINQQVSVQAGANNTTGTNGLSAADFFSPLWEILGYASRVAAGPRIRLKLVAPSSDPADNTVYGHVTYVVD